MYIYVPLWYSRLFLQGDASRGSVTGLEGRPLTFGEVLGDEVKSTALAHPRRQSYYQAAGGWDKQLQTYTMQKTIVHVPTLPCKR